MIRYYCDWCERQTPPGELSSLEWVLTGAQPLDHIVSGSGYREKHDPLITTMKCQICEACKHAANLPAAEVKAKAWLIGVQASLEVAARARASELSQPAPQPNTGEPHER